MDTSSIDGGAMEAAWDDGGPIDRIEEEGWGTEPAIVSPFPRSQSRKTQLKADDEDYLTIFSFLHSIDPTIEGFCTAVVLDDGSWSCIVFYKNGEQGVINGRGMQATSMQGGSHFDVIPKEALARRAEADPDYEFDRWLETRRE